MFSLKLFGVASLEGPEGALSGRAGQRHRLALLALLASRSGGMSRDKLVAYLWPEAEPERVRHLLSNSLYVLRQALREEALVGSGDTVRLNAELVHSDVHGFEAALAQGELERAVSLYRGPFMDGFFLSEAPELEQWIEGERARLSGSYTLALEALAEAAEGKRDFRGAVAWWTARAAQDPYDSRVALRLMRAQEAAGNRAGALQHASVHQRRLAEELGIEPAPEIESLAQRLRSEPVTHAVPTPPAESESSLPAEQLPALPVPSPERVSAPPARRGRRRLAIALALGGATLVIALATAWFRSSRSPSMPLDPGRILVVPFQAAVHPSLDYLGEGMVDLVAARLNGETGSRTVDPRSGLVAWRQATGGARGDLPLAGSARIARDLGAGLLLTGSVVGASDRLTLNGTLFDAASLAVRVRVSTTGPADSLTALVDRLVGQLLAREAVLPRHQLGALTTASLPALQAYLEGRRSYRLGRYREAVVHLESALHHDSTFALAAIQLWFAAGPGQLTAEPGTQAEALRLAWAARDRLSPVDRLFLDALAGPRYPDPTPRHELRAALRRALDASPDQPEVLALMGMFHGGDVIRGEAGAEPRSSFYFRKALKLDSAYGIPVHNLVREAASNGDAMTVQRLVRRYLAADSTSELAQLLQWLDAASSADQRAILQIRSRIPHMHPTALGWIASHALLFGLDMEGAESALVALRATARSDREMRNLLGWEWDHMGNRGRLDALWRARESRALETARDGPIEELNLSAEQRARGQRAIWLLGTKLFWGGDTTGIGAALDLMEDGYRRSPAPDGHPFARVIVAESACFAGMGRLATGEIAAARKAVAALRNLLARPWTVPERPSHVACAATLEAALAVAEGRPDARRAAEQADSVLRAQPPVRVVSNRMHLLLARAFDALSDPVAALRVIRRRELSNPPDYFATILREEGHLAVRAGDREGAIRAFQHYLVLRADPDPALLPEVQEVRQALAALIAR